MQKYILLIKPDSHSNHNNFQQQLLNAAQSLANTGAKHVRLNKVDQAVAGADSLRISQQQNPYQAMISFWLSDERFFNTVIDCFSGFSTDLAGYRVQQHEPILNEQYPSSAGQRTEGMNQVVLLEIPPRLDREQWLDIWLNSHGQIACDIQSTFGYRQNIVTKVMTHNAPTVDAIVEENFPAAAMTDSSAFYGCPGDEQETQRRQQQMIDSVVRFIDFDKIECLPMSEYNFD
ncbi:hypothetical protein SIN8267_00488 [Sinobacterium norvegicum]|uniref:EthD domain-containing protein n=1 Tax=Sinobacterium norvegicum TaxID=1641715 RepID=A0ABN8ED60_9GAMM|nr:EthD domain-containing protein [Sinobacterium norvegicum]CAH0990396.1 hypothetical protein SIN8267_00488 [Sinobacterium norvegicum]